MANPSPRSAFGWLDQNWGLWLGLLGVGAIFILALWGPMLAPVDPVKETFIIQDPATGIFVKPPYTPFQLPSFPLGSDEFGRDLLSRVLWGIAPTLMLVMVVAAIRIICGVVIGILSGWLTGRAAQMLNTLIALAIAVPVLFVALCVIAATGQAWGVGAFVIGLALTGWGETARLVRQQTIVVKAQPYVEAARALGASGGQILIRHILPHIMPLVWTMLAFEASGALLTTASLGFLGYFVNAVWVPGDSDFVGIRASGKPELAQMLAISSAIALQRNPWGIVVAGAVIALMVLTFNLLGEGLREQLSPESRWRRQGHLRALVTRLLNSVEDRLLDPLSPWRQALPTLTALSAVGAILLVGGYTLWQSSRGLFATSSITVPGDHLWASEAHDAQGTYWTKANGPANPTVAWRYAVGGAVLGGPVVAADGTVYVAAQDATLHAVTPDGQMKWKAILPEAPFGTPAIGSSGDVYVVGVTGSLTAVKATGEVRWTVKGEGRMTAISGPIVDAEETVFYATESVIRAITLDGLVKWQADLPTYSYASPLPRLSGDGLSLMFEDTLTNVKNGSPRLAETNEPLDSYFVGMDGGIYLRQQFAIAALELTETGGQFRQKLKWDGRALALGFRFPRLAGITPLGRTWIYYLSGVEFAKMVWLDERGEALTPLDYPYRAVAQLIGIDGADVTYMCGQLTSGRSVRVECRANRPGNSTAIWRVDLPVETKTGIGGAVVSGRLYLTFGEGELVALADP